jgi:hypothetical protein
VDLPVSIRRRGRSVRRLFSTARVAKPTAPDRVWEYVHVCVDDYSRLAHAEVLPDQSTSTIVGFLLRAVGFYRRNGITIERPLTGSDGGSGTPLHALACKALGIRHLRNRPYRQQINGKAGRFIRTLINGWGYGAIYRSSWDVVSAERWDRARTPGGLCRLDAACLVALPRTMFATVMTGLAASRRPPRLAKPQTELRDSATRARVHMPPGYRENTNDWPLLFGAFKFEDRPDAPRAPSDAPIGSARNAGQGVVALE